MARQPSHDDVSHPDRLDDRSQVTVRRFLPAFSALLDYSLTLRDWLMIAGTLGIVALNMYLWSLPITQVQLFCISAPFGLCALLGMLWYVGRE